MRWGLRSKLTFRAILILGFSADVRVCVSAVDQSTRVHTLACSDLPSTPTMGFFFFPITCKRRGKRGEGGLRGSERAADEGIKRQPSLEFEHLNHVDACR